MSSLRACLRLVAERETKETINTKYYDVITTPIITTPIILDYN